ncbi:MAG: HDIG domain-containing protein [Clostridiales bacterium]|nr:HDIG domain-containing protein [Clostridiales bacterium]
MGKTKSQKILSWETKDIVLVAVTYIVNLIVIGALFLAAVELTDGIGTYFSNVVTPIHFFILLSLVIAVMVFYFIFEEKNFLKVAANSEMLFLIIELSLIICFVTGEYVGIYLRPLALAAIMTLFLVNRRTAIFMNFIFCILVFLFDAFVGTSFSIDNYPALIMGFTSGIIATVCLDNVYSRLKLLIMSTIISVPTIICIAMSILANGTENAFRDIICGAFSGPLAVAAFLLLLPIFEAMFKKVSSFKFSELTDHKSTIIRRIIEQAPGTFNHSIVVSNIAEACASAIGEDALLARTCAYYHDCGKLRQPEFFKENQADGYNPHDDLTPELSANIIKSHTQDGYNLIMKHRLPKVIADVCVEHHGTLPILYFYGKAKKFTDGEVDIAQYCYPGPKPRTKIAAIIMIADGCEAAARSLQDRSRENVKKVVRQIVNERMELGQFEDCEITLKELNIIIHTIVNNLTGIYHSRIEYPKVNLDGIKL